MRISGPEILLVLLLVLLLFGAKRLPDLARSIGKALKAFRHEVRGVKDELDIDEHEEKRE